MWIIHALPTFLSCHYVEMWSLQTMFLIVFLQIFFIFLKVFIVCFDAIFINGLQETLLTHIHHVVVNDEVYLMSFHVEITINLGAATL